MFFRKKNDLLVSPLDENSRIDLTIGDSFGLLIDEFWFSIGTSNVNADILNGQLNDVKRKSDGSDSNSDSTNKKAKTSSNELEHTNDLSTTLDAATPSTSANIPPSEAQTAGTSLPIVTIKSEPVDSNENQSVTIVVKSEPQSQDGYVNSAREPFPVPVKIEVKEEHHSDDNDEATTSNGSTNRPQRDCCRYGIRCYR